GSRSECRQRNAGSHVSAHEHRSSATEGKRMRVPTVDEWRPYRGQTLEFGKYKGTAWRDVPTEYLQWLAAQVPRVPAIVRTRRALCARSELLYREAHA